MTPDCLLSMLLLIPEPDLEGTVNSWLTASNVLRHSVISAPPLG
jgi:hypothetical protein